MSEEKEIPRQVLIKEKYKELGYPAVNTLYRAIKNKEKWAKFVTIKEIRDVIKKQKEHQENIKSKKMKKAYVPIYAKDSGNYQCDIMFMDDLESKNDGYRAILVIIEMTTRKLYAYALKTKTGEEVSEKLEEFIRKAEEKHGDKVKVIETDGGSEFSNKTVQDIFTENYITHINVAPEDHSTVYGHSLGIVDRVIRTIRERFQKHFTATDSHNWVDYLDKIVGQYNNTYHYTLRKAPNKMTKKDAKQLRTKLALKAFEVKQENIKNMQVGSIVKALMAKDLFQKGTEPRFSKEKYRITRIEGANFYLQNIDGGEELKDPFRRYQLRKIEKDVEKDEKPEVKQVDLREERKELRKAKRVTRRVKKEGIEQADEQTLNEPRAKRKAAQNASATISRNTGKRQKKNNIVLEITPVTTNTKSS